MIGSEWLTANRHLRHSNQNRNSIFIRKEHMLRQMFFTASKTSISRCGHIIIDSHEGMIQYFPQQNKVVCDTHFADYATLIAAVFYTNSSQHDIKRIVNAMLADSMVKSDDMAYALYFAREYINGPLTSMIEIPADDSLIKKVLVSRSLQSFFAIRHELAHLDYQSGNSIWEYFFEHLRSMLVEKIKEHNTIAKSINSINLLPLMPELSAIKTYVTPAFEFPPSEDYGYRIAIAWQQIDNLIKKRKEVLLFNQDREWEEFRSMLYFACDNYIHNKKSSLLDENEFIEECLCDLLSLLELLDIRVDVPDRYTTFECAIEAYLLCILTQNMLHSAQNIQKLNLGKGYTHVDNLYVRLFLEEQFVSLLLDLYGLIHDDLSMIADKTRILTTFYKAKSKIEAMYAEFSDYIFTFSFDDIDEKYISPNDPKWMEYYEEVERLLQFPV